MRGDFTLLVLKTIQTAANTATAIADAMSSYSITNTNRRFWGGMKKSRQYKPILEKQIADLKFRQYIFQTIAKLKKEGLIDGKRSQKLNLTQKGSFKIKQMEKIRDAKPNYEVVQSNEVKIITFDIPESKRLQRDWLREALKNLKFNFLQKSVWFGTTILPEEFMENLREREIFDHVEIFAVTKSGTLRQMR
jgi:DNA-binding transcriptional regulator PaaX